MPELYKQESLTFYFFASVNRDGASVMYQPTTVAINIGWFGGVPWMMILICLAIISILSYAVWHFKNKADVTKEKLDYEMNDIRNIARVPHVEDASEDQPIG